MAWGTYLHFWSGRSRTLLACDRFMVAPDSCLLPVILKLYINKIYSVMHIVHNNIFSKSLARLPHGHDATAVVRGVSGDPTAANYLETHESICIYVAHGFVSMHITITSHKAC